MFTEINFNAPKILQKLKTKQKKYDIIRVMTLGDLYAYHGISEVGGVRIPK